MFPGIPHRRRDFLSQLGSGLGSLALTHLLADDKLLADTSRIEQDGGFHRRPKVARVLQLFMNGGVSQMDTFDYKPELARRHGEQIDFGIKAAATSVPGGIMRSPFSFKQYGESGQWVSSVFPQMAEWVDELAFLMAMVSKTNVHGPASYLQTTGFEMPGFPCMGAWISYALGRLSDNLPSFVVLPDPEGYPFNNTGNFSPAFLPAAHQGIVVKTHVPQPIVNLHPPEFAEYITPQSEADGLNLLRELDGAHAATHQGDSRLEARIEGYELAARMQLSAPEALDLSQETESTRRMYGLDKQVTADFGRHCLSARRLLERGVRFVQVWSGAAGGKRQWDHHESIPRDLPPLAQSVDQPISGLLADLKQRGLLSDTLVVFTSEFGRMPFTQAVVGRDHNAGTFVTWLAGAGIRGGVRYGQSDDFSYRAAENATSVHDLHATILHLLGIDHERLTVRHNGVNRRLTDVHGHIIKKVLA